MTEVTKQHYVWKRYLKPWQEDESPQIWTQILKSNSIKKVGLSSVAQANYFYRLNELTPEEISSCRELLSKFNFDPYSYRLSNDILTAYEALPHIEEPGRSQIANYIIEQLNTSIEKTGHELINCRNINDFIKIKNIYTPIFFICMQYCRTNCMRQRIISLRSNNSYASDLADKAFPFIMVTTALAITRGIVNCNDCRFVFLQNETGIPFITSDQPVINLRNEERDDDGLPIGLELFYPITPQSALLISENCTYAKYDQRTVDNEQVETFNKAIIKNAHNFLFASSVSQLENLI